MGRPSFHGSPHAAVAEKDALSRFSVLESLAPLIASAATQRGELAAEERAILEANPK